jgi:hypothetical protein
MRLQTVKQTVWMLDTFIALMIIAFVVLTTIFN